ncbi:aldo/keto reductase [Microlunatus sp. Y2014]|uniref:aldo/keto reductase n=1 Tax=Microlunatus sp. Y2014 TaxID=3418488 RepID=UPI003DA76034
MKQIPTVQLLDGTSIPQLGYGTYQVDPAETFELVRTALELGHRHIDTAALYANEEGVGRAIKESGIPRDEVYVTTKVWNDRHHEVPQAMAESLERLGLDHVDLYLVHWPAPVVGDYRTAWQELIKLREQGLTTSIGVSNFAISHLDQIIADTDVVPVINQVELHPTFPQTELVAHHTKLGIVTEAWAPLGKGADLDGEVVGSIASRIGATPAQVVLAWHLAKGYVVFPKSANPKRIVENFDLDGVSLTDDDISAIDTLDTGNRQGADPETATF